jgi:hypothetical protein
VRFSIRGLGAAIALMTALTVASRAAIAATCTGSDQCRACKNCHYCRHCAKEGGTCGICKRLATPATKDRHLLLTAKKRQNS